MGRHINGQILDKYPCLQMEGSVDMELSHRRVKDTTTGLAWGKLKLNGLCKTTWVKSMLALKF